MERSLEKVLAAGVDECEGVWFGNGDHWAWLPLVLPEDADEESVLWADLDNVICYGVARFYGRATLTAPMLSLSEHLAELACTLWKRGEYDVTITVLLEYCEKVHVTLRMRFEKESC